MLSHSVGQPFPFEHISSLPPRQRLHLILLGVRDVQASAKFYENLGWQRSPTSNEGFVKFNLQGYALCLINKDDLAKDAGFESSQTTAFTGAAYIYLAKAPEDVPAILKRAQEAGGKVVKPATRTPYGIAGYFTDPDGHLFEVDYENAWVFNPQHQLLVDQVNE